jgi:DNA-binding LacI/PurR family transcriptional regulator
VVARRTGYRHALSNFGIIYQEAWDFVEPDDGNYDVLFQRIEMMPDSPTAIVAAHDTQARRFMEAAARLGIAIPGRFSVTGTGGHWMTRETERLTTVLNHYERVGQAGIKALLRQIAGEDPATLHELIPVELVVRETTGPPFV